MSKRDQIKAIGMDLAVGETATGELCPYCNRADDKQLSVTRKEYGLLFFCFRAKCGARGFVPSVGHARVATPKAKPKIFSHETRALTDAERKTMEKRWGTVSPYWRMTTDDIWLVMPVKTFNGYTWGYVTKRMQGTGTKSIMYQESITAPKLHFPRALVDSTINLVEDIISAERVPNGVALLGTHLALNDAIHFRNIGVRRIRVCLDADAVGAAYAIRNTYNLLFDSINIITWNSDNDPKDMDDDEFYNVFGDK